MPKREMKPAKKKAAEQKERAERDREKFLEGSARVRHVLALDQRIAKLEQEVAKTLFQWGVFVELIEKKRVFPGIRFLKKGRFNAELKKKFAEVKAQVEAEKKAAEEEKKANQPARKES